MNKSNRSSTHLATFSTKLIFLEICKIPTPILPNILQTMILVNEEKSWLLIMTYCGAKEQLNDKCLSKRHSFHIQQQRRIIILILTTMVRRFYWHNCWESAMRYWQVRKWDGGKRAKAGTGEYWWSGKTIIEKWSCLWTRAARYSVTLIVVLTILLAINKDIKVAGWVISNTKKRIFIFQSAVFYNTLFQLTKKVPECSIAIFDITIMIKNDILCSPNVNSDSLRKLWTAASLTFSYIPM